MEQVLPRQLACVSGSWRNLPRRRDHLFYRYPESRPSFRVAHPSPDAVFSTRRMNGSFVPRLHEAGAESNGHGLGPVGEAELHQDAVYVGFDRRLAEE